MFTMCFLALKVPAVDGHRRHCAGRRSASATASTSSHEHGTRTGTARGPQLHDPLVVLGSSWYRHLTYHTGFTSIVIVFHLIRIVHDVVFAEDPRELEVQEDLRPKEPARRKDTHLLRSPCLVSNTFSVSLAMVFTSSQTRLHSFGERNKGKKRKKVKKGKKGEKGNKTEKRKKRKQKKEKGRKLKKRRQKG